MSKKKRTIMSLIVLLGCVLAVSATLAWFTDSDETKNRIRIGEFAHTETFVVSLLAVSFVSEKIDSSADIEIADTTGVGEVESFVNRIPYTAKKTSAQDRFNRIFIIFPETLVAPLVFVVFRITIYSHISTETCFRSQSRTCSTDVDNAVQG